MARVVGWILILLAIASQAASAGSQPATAPAGTDPAIWKRLLEVDSRAAAVCDITATFQQSKFTPLLKKPLISKGAVRAAGSCMFWETVEPAHTVMRIDGSTAAIYYPQERLEEIYPITGQLGALAVSPLPRLDVLKEHFRFALDAAKELDPAADEARLLAVRLTPIDASLRQHVDHVRVLLDINTGLMIRCEMTDADGDRTVISFTDVRTNTGVSEDQMTIRLPSDVKIVRPLENLPTPPESKSENQGR